MIPSSLPLLKRYYKSFAGNLCPVSFCIARPSSNPNDRRVIQNCFIKLSFTWIHHILAIDLYKPSSKSGATNNTIHNCITSWDTVDGRNPAPVDEKFIPLFTGFYTSQVVQDFFHQQHLSGCKGFTNGCKQNGAPSASPALVSFLKTHPAKPSPLQHHTVETQDAMGIWNNNTEKLLVTKNEHPRFVTHHNILCNCWKNNLQ